MKAFNLAKFKKMKEDKDWADLIHEDGHQLRIAKAPLSSIQRKQLENLKTHYADGGEVSGDEFVQAEPISPAPSAQEALPIAPQSQVIAQGSPESAIPVSPTVPINPQPFQTPIQAKVPGFEEEKAANLEKAQAEAKEGALESQAYQGILDKLPAQTEPLKSQEQIIKNYKDSNDKLFKSYQDQKIDPSHYWKDHSKVAGIVGVALAGIGQALGQGRIQSNAAIDAIQHGIAREVELQRNDQEKKLNLYKINRAALGDDLAANLATQNQLYTGLKYKIDKAASESKKPIALANAKIANAHIDQVIGQNNFKLSLFSPSSDNQDPASRVQFLVPEGRQQKVVDEINAAKNTVANAPGILEAFDQASKEVRPLTGGTQTSLTAFVPGMKSAGQQALQARLGPTFQDVEGTVRQAAMDNLDANVTPKFGDSDETVATKRKSLQDYLHSKSSAAASKSFGIDLTRFPTTNTRAVGTNPNQVKVVNGVTYMRGPNGEAVRVK